MSDLRNRRGLVRLEGRPRFAILAVILGLSGVGAIQGRTDDGRPPAKERITEGSEVRIVRDIAYRDLQPGENAAAEKNKLDLYLPSDRKDFPVLVFIHGGAWRQGSKDFLGLYASFALYWAHHGIGVVVPNYRLSPSVQHPAHIQDVSKAFAWTERNIARYGGRPDALFISGHSAGGHLAALLATDERYLKAEGLNLSAVKGAIPISGVYRIYGPYLDANPAPSGGRPTARFSFVFTADPAVRKDASPMNHIRPGLPPFLVIYGDRDLPTLPDMAREFGADLRKSHDEVQVVEVKKRSHMTVFLNASRAGDPAAQAIQKFIAGHTPVPSAPKK